MCNSIFHTLLLAFSGSYTYIQEDIRIEEAAGMERTKQMDIVYWRRNH